MDVFPFRFRIGSSVRAIRPVSALDKNWKLRSSEASVMVIGVVRR